MSIFDTSELAESATVRKIRIVQTEGNREVTRDVTTKVFFKAVQNKLHWAVTGRTAGEIIADRADASESSMGRPIHRGHPRTRMQLGHVRATRLKEVRATADALAPIAQIV